MVLFFLSLLGVALGLSVAAPGMVGGDAPELTTAAYTLGPAHAPGYPLYIVLGRLFELLPLGTQAFRMTFLSIVAQSAAFPLLTWTLQKTWNGQPPNRPVKGDRFYLESWVFAGLTASLVMSLPLVLRQFTGPEVFALHLLFAALLLEWVLFPSSIRFYAAAFTGGLALSHQHLTLLLLPSLAWAYRGYLGGAKRPAVAMSLFLAGLSLYVVLPLRAVQHPLVNWGNPSNFHQFLFDVTRAQYGGDVIPGSLSDGAWDLFLYLKDFTVETCGLGPLFLLMGLFKNRAELKTAYFIGGFCLWVLLPFLLRAPTNPESNHINEAFLPPAILWITPLLLRGLAWFYGKLKKGRSLLAPVLAALMVFCLVGAYGGTDASRNLAVEDVARDLLQQLPSRSVVYSEGDAITFPLAYLKLVLKLRMDVPVFDRTSGLFGDLYHLLDYRQNDASPLRLLEAENNFEKANHPPAVFYTEKSTVFGRPLSREGLLFRAQAQTLVPGPESFLWLHFRSPRIRETHDYLSRETASRFYLFKAGFDLGPEGDPALVRSDLNQALAVSYDNPRLWINAGVIEEGQGWDAEAAATFQKACELDPRSFLAWFDRGVAVERQGDLDRAAGYFQKSVELNPGYADAYRNLGVLYQQKDPGEAGRMFRKYLELRPQAPDRDALEGWLGRQKY